MKHSCKVVERDASNMRAEQKYLASHIIIFSYLKGNLFQESERIIFCTWYNFPQAIMAYHCLTELNNLYWFIFITSMLLHFPPFPLSQKTIQ